jgi:hypothetical protein
MVKNQYFAHTSPDGVSPWHWFKSAGYNYKYAGENLAIGFYESEEVYNAWLNSPSHRANIVNPNYTQVGTAVLSGYDQNGTIVVVQEFGTQATVAKVVDTKVEPVKTKTPEAPVTVTAPVQTQAIEAEAPVAQTTQPVIEEEVLSQSIETESNISTSVANNTNNGFSRLLNSAIYNYDEILQNVIYGVSSIIVGILFALILFNFNFDFNKELVFRAVIIAVLLSATTLLDKEIILTFIPHQIII